MQWMTYASAVASDRRRLGRPSAQRCWESLAPPIGWVVDVVTDALLFVVPGWQWPAFAGVRGDTGRRGTSILAAGGWSNCCLRHASAKGSLRRRTLGQRFGKRAWAFSPTTARRGVATLFRRARGPKGRYGKFFATGFASRSKGGIEHAPCIGDRQIPASTGISYVTTAVISPTSRD